MSMGKSWLSESEICLQGGVQGDISDSGTRKFPIIMSKGVTDTLRMLCLNMCKCITNSHKTRVTSSLSMRSLWKQTPPCGVIFFSAFPGTGSGLGYEGFIALASWLSSIVSAVCLWSSVKASRPTSSISSSLASVVRRSGRRTCRT